MFFEVLARKAAAWQKMLKCLFSIKWHLEAEKNVQIGHHMPAHRRKYRRDGRASIDATGVP